MGVKLQVGMQVLIILESMAVPTIQLRLMVPFLQQAMVAQILI